MFGLIILLPFTCNSLLVNKYKCTYYPCQFCKCTKKFCVKKNLKYSIKKKKRISEPSSLKLVLKKAVNVKVIIKQSRQSGSSLKLNHQKDYMYLSSSISLIFQLSSSPIILAYLVNILDTLSSSFLLFFFHNMAKMVCKSPST